MRMGSEKIREILRRIRGGEKLVIPSDDFMERTSTEQEEALLHWRVYIRERTNDILLFMGGDVDDEIDLYSVFNDKRKSGLTGEVMCDELCKARLLVIEAPHSDITDEAANPDRSHESTDGIKVKIHEKLIRHVRTMLESAPVHPQNIDALTEDIIVSFLSYVSESATPEGL